MKNKIKTIVSFLMLFTAVSLPLGGAMKTVQQKVFKVTSSSFTEGGMIPDKYYAKAQNYSPQLKWDKAPSGTKSFALIADDPDAPSKVWVHWVMYNIPSEVTELTEHTPSTGTLTNGAIQGVNDSGAIGYSGPNPPSGTHRYFFKVYALDTMLNIKPGATKQELENAIKGHIIASGQLIGKYQSKH